MVCSACAVAPGLAGARTLQVSQPLPQPLASLPPALAN